MHAKDGGAPLHSEVKRRATAKTSALAGPSKASVAIDPATLEQIEASSDGLVDLETAAMLMTDLHHKATAAMTKQESDPGVRATERVYSPGPTALLDPSMALGPGPVSLPPVPWDPFISPTLNGGKAHSISSSVSGSQDSHTSIQSFTSVSTLQPHPDQPSPLTERHPTAVSVAPAPQTQPVSATGSPGPQSPRSHDINSRSPASVGQQLTPKTPQVENDEERNQILDGIRVEDPENSLIDAFRLPTLPSLNRYLSTYFTLFHHHLPFLHPASFKPATVSPPLLLAVLSIGALYTFEQDQAYMLHIGSKVLVNQFLQNKENFSSRKCPLWTMQSTLLNMIFASWSGDPKGLEWACSIKSLLANVCISCSEFASS